MHQHTIKWVYGQDAAYVQAEEALNQEVRGNSHFSRQTTGKESRGLLALSLCPCVPATLSWEFPVTKQAALEHLQGPLDTVSPCGPGRSL